MYPLKRIGVIHHSEMKSNSFAVFATSFNGDDFTVSPVSRCASDPARRSDGPAPRLIVSVGCFAASVL